MPESIDSTMLIPDHGGFVDMGVKSDDVGPILDGIFDWLADKVIDWALGGFQTLVTYWISDTYSVSLNGEAGGILYFLREHANWLTLVMAFAGFLVAAFRVAVQRKGEPFRAALSQFFELAAIVLIVATVVNLANVGGDRYSDWILNDARPKNDQWIDDWKSGFGPLKSADTMFILLIFGLAAAVATAVQFALMLFRSGVLIVLIGILPTVAASRFSTYGNQAYRKCVGWLISFILYKPVAATIYAAAFRLMASKYEADRLFGLALLAGAVFSLPAVMRAVMPAVAEDNSSFGIRQVGHFVFGSSAVNAGKLTTVGSGTGKGLQKLFGGSDGGPEGSGRKGGGPGRGGPGARGGAPSGAMDDQAPNIADRGIPGVVSSGSGTSSSTSKSASLNNGRPNGSGKDGARGERSTVDWASGNRAIPYTSPQGPSSLGYSSPGFNSPGYTSPGRPDFSDNPTGNDGNRD
ncbi:hypothetical protein [Spirillospora sp. CA-128828]|uniref:hypothetical protein n=1 Tax=Spirillospora sp. CA-128828 TaxID=3240033 RepID=UPI003D89D6B7